MHSTKNFLDHPSQGKVWSWIMFYREQMEQFHLLECTIHILSNDVNASGAQSAPILDVETASKKKQSWSPFGNIGCVSDGNDKNVVMLCKTHYQRNRFLDCDLFGHHSAQKTASFNAHTKRTFDSNPLLQMEKL